MEETSASREREMDVSISVKLPSTLRDLSRQKSERTGVPLSFIVRRALEDWINDSVTFVFPSEKDRKRGEKLLNEQLYSHILTVGRGAKEDGFSLTLRINPPVSKERLSSLTRTMRGMGIKVGDAEQPF